MSSSGVVRSDVAYVGAANGTMMMLGSDSFAPIAYYGLVMDANQNLYLSKGALGDAFYSNLLPGYQLLYATPTYYSEASGAIPAGSTTVALSTDVAGATVIGYLYQDGQAGTISVAPNPAPVIFTTTDPDVDSTNSNGVMAGVRYQFSPSVNINTVGTLQQLDNGLYIGETENITSVNSSLLWFTFVPNTAYLAGSCNALSSMTGGLPSTVAIAQCYALSGNGYTTIDTCSSMNSSAGFTNTDDCANYSSLYYYAQQGGNCGSTYKFLNFKNVNQQVTSSVGPCTSGDTCLLDQDTSLYSCSTSSSSNSRLWLWLIVIFIVFIVIVIIIVAIIAAASKSKKKSQEVVE